jgi:hypothetical protein
VPFFVPALLIAGRVAAGVAAKQAAKAIAKRQRAAKRAALGAIRNTPRQFGSVARTLIQVGRDPNIRRAVVRGLIRARNFFPSRSGARQLCSALARIIRPPRTISSLIKNSRVLQINQKTKLIQFGRRGGVRQANRDFNSLTRGLPKGRVKPHGGGVRSAKLNDGSTITVYPKSSGGPPTLRIQAPKGSQDWLKKIRYK